MGLDLTEVEKSAQIKRYQAHLPNLLLTDYLEFRWYVQGERGLEKTTCWPISARARGAPIPSSISTKPSSKPTTRSCANSAASITRPSRS